MSLAGLPTPGGMDRAGIVQSEIPNPQERRAMDCYFAPAWGPENELTWDPYPGDAQTRICLEARVGDHYGWHTPWYRLGCVSSLEDTLRPQDYLRPGPFRPVVKFRAVAVRDAVVPDCEGPAHYCDMREVASEPSNEVCGGVFLPLF